MLTVGVCVSLTVFMSNVTNGKVWLYWGFIDEWHLSTYSHLHYHTLLSLSQFGSVLYSFSSHSTARIIYINTAAYSGAVKTCLNKFKLADTWKCVAVGIWLDILWPDCDICHFTCIAFFDDTIHSVAGCNIPFTNDRICVSIHTLMDYGHRHYKIAWIDSFNTSEVKWISKWRKNSIC